MLELIAARLLVDASGIYSVGHFDYILHARQPMVDNGSDNFRYAKSGNGFFAVQCNSD